MLYFIFLIGSTTILNQNMAYLLYDSYHIEYNTHLLNPKTLLANAYSKNFIDFVYYISLFENVPCIYKFYNQNVTLPYHTATYEYDKVNELKLYENFKKEIINEIEPFEDEIKVQNYKKLIKQMVDEIKEIVIIFKDHNFLIKSFIDRYITQKECAIFNGIFGILLENIFYKRYDREIDKTKFKETFTLFNEQLVDYKIMINSKYDNFINPNIISHLGINYLYQIIINRKKKNLEKDYEIDVRLYNEFIKLFTLKNKLSDLKMGSFYFKLENNSLVTYKIYINKIDGKIYKQEIKNVYKTFISLKPLLKELESDFKHSLILKMGAFFMARIFYDIIRNKNKPIQTYKREIYVFETYYYFNFLIINAKVHKDIKNKYIKLIFTYILDNFNRDIDFENICGNLNESNLQYIKIFLNKKINAKMILKEYNYEVTEKSIEETQLIWTYILNNFI